LRSMSGCAAGFRPNTERKPGLHRLSAGGSRIRTFGPPSQGRMQTPRSPPIGSGGAADWREIGEIRVGWWLRRRTRRFRRSRLLRKGRRN
jgi:hypothetical protein